MTEFYDTLSAIVNVTGWVHGYDALSPQLNWAWNEVAVMEHLFPDLPNLSEYKTVLRSITRDSNALLFHLVEDVSYAFSDTRPHDWSPVGSLVTTNHF